MVAQFAIQTDDSRDHLPEDVCRAQIHGGRQPLEFGGRVGRNVERTRPTICVLAHNGLPFPMMKSSVRSASLRYRLHLPENTANATGNAQSGMGSGPRRPARDERTVAGDGLAIGRGGEELTRRLPLHVAYGLSFCPFRRSRGPASRSCSSVLGPPGRVDPVGVICRLGR